MRAVAAVLCLILLTGPAAAAPASSPAEERPTWLIPTLHAAGLLVTLRVGASLLWPDTFDPSAVGRNAATFARSFSQAPALDGKQRFFEWDGDPWPLNLFGHGLMGSEIYLRYRQAGHQVGAATLILVAWSLIWEYLLEAWHKHPSGIDLVWTPAGGMLLGEGRFQLYRRVLRLRPSAGRHLLLYLIDPLGQLERDLLGLRY